MKLLIGSADDPHLTSIYQHLEQAGQSVSILDTSREALLNTQFSYLSAPHQLMITQQNQVIQANDISAVFCLLPLYARKGFVSSNEKDFWHFTWREALCGFYAYLAEKSFFINRKIFTALAAQNKIHFFQAAKNAGICAPATLIGNNKQDIQTFFNKYPQVVIKTMHQIYLEYQNEQTMMLVKKVNQADFAQFETQNECPVFLQQAIDKVFDVRAIVVGKQIFGCKIDASQSPVGNLDWRAYDLPNTIHKIFDIPVDIQNKLLKVLEYFELDYACLDLCVDKNGEFWLLDVNPFGRYKWIELAVGLEISQAIAELLLKMRR